MSQDDGERAEGDAPGEPGGGDDGPEEGPSLDGMALEDAVEAVVAADEDRDPEAVREALTHVSEDGVVTRAAVDDALGELSKVVATPETRVELAEMALEEAREAAEPVADLAVVRGRLDEYEAELAGLSDRLETLQASLSAAVDRADDPDSLYAVGRDCREVTARANALQGDADDLKFELEREFDRWLSDAGARVDRLDEDVDAAEAMLDDLKGVAEALDDAEEGETPTLPGGEAVTDPAVAWFDAALRVRVADLLLSDLRAELADLRTWAGREREGEGEDADGEVPDEGEEPTLDAVEARLDSLDVRASGLEDWLAALAEPAWRRRFGDRATTFEHALDDRAAPVDWGAVQATLDEHRAAALGTE